MRRTSVATYAVLLALAVLVGSSSGCLQAPPSMSDTACDHDGVHFRGADYHPIAGGINTPRLGRALGTAPKLSCNGKVSRFTREVFAMPGLDPADVVLGGRKSGYPIWARESLTLQDLPDFVADVRKFLPCRGPATFTGRWEFIDPEDVPSFDDYLTAEVPYRGYFSAHRGEGLPFDRWSSIRIVATISSATAPLPSDRVLDGALGPDRAPVRAQVRCSGDGYVVVSLALA